MNKQINTTQPFKKKNMYKYLFYIMISILIYTIIVYVTNYQSLQKNYNKLIISEKNADFSNKCPDPEYNLDGFDYNYSNKFFPENLVFRIKNVGFLFPKSSYSIFSGQHLVSLNNKFYSIAVKQTAGLCPEYYNNEDGEYISPPLCTYDDEKLNLGNADRLRIWRDNNRIFAINPMTVGWGINSVNGMVITKQSTNLLSKETLYFTTEEVQMWKEILREVVPLSKEN